ncbi:MULTISPECIES: poly-beta-1,6-N-acetyl-D-glucosamine biosynthesis protein PgaD [Enterobacter]|uniref:poly-beta-1,6-N-acetyl-D-glucosamine biosynthesis protein PgaD n=1 Tax=Enterobacter TaxID=547 RepID=UPI000450BACE|nr:MULTISPECIES: poly-beta-1,6-N-acetyl-D-glucosamine biosynthesis protein PgaD [Enterobacter]EUM16500.1 poly-beta-1,6-N-acetyl-D-glucosamine biosynthesis protein PgaD [Enterobacter sp. BIDMC 29]KSX62950.1 poly-beta-1,6-N-acetyl-D-glucosamine biosynthesis protein PgaD [Enterobacter sp. 50588862]MBE4809962.1 poly-beta-1,6-N-acetyl-D-glucosamine biosynthesis protein PgaD [Enterobacter cloacae complex sp. P44RS]MBE4828054.1 poly-beta-1,6-N-acetyl-D-glucosamine biosynthesis protein PgaD [Enterobact
MNENTLILTEHRLLPRLFDAALTVVAWGGFLFFLYARLWMQLTEESDHRWSVIIASFNTVLIYLLFAALNGWLLILWYQYNRRRANVRRRQPSLLHHDELARSFNVSPQLISEMSQHNLLTVYHDQIGRIIELKTSAQQDEEAQ